MLTLVRRRLQAKLLIAFVVVLLIPTTIIAFYAANATTQALIDQTRDDELSRRQSEAAKLTTFFGRAKSDLLYLSEIPTMKRYANAVSTDDRETVTAVIPEIQQAILIFSKHVPIYAAIDLIDGKGYEIASVDLAASGPVIITDSPYEGEKDTFKKALVLPSGGIYASQVSLNVEDGQIEVPHKPVISFSTPIYGPGANGKIVGVFVMHMLADSFLSQLNSGGTEKSIYLIDSDGTYLYGPNEAQLFGRDLKTDANFLKNRPGGAQILSASEGTIYEAGNQPGLLESFAHVTPPGLDNVHWTVYKVESQTGLLAEVNNERLVILLIAGVSLLIAVIIALLFTRGIVRPIRQLITATEAISLEKWDTPLPSLSGQDEIGELNRAFGKMATDLSAAAEFRKHAAELELANGIAREANRAKSEFLAVMSHELRTPLNAIVGFTGIITMSKKLDTQSSHMLQRIRANSERLLALINDILDISRIESGRMQLANDKVAIRNLVERLRYQMQVLAEEKSLELNIQVEENVPQTILSDQDALAKVMTNLLSNAFKFTDKGRVSLKVSRLDAQPPQLQIEVSDTGIGVPSHMQEIIFESFRQVDSSSTREKGGSGLGLSIVRHLCNEMGGSVRVSSVPGEGSTFTITLPVTEVAEEERVLA